MRVSLVAVVDWIFPSFLRGRVLPLARAVDSIVYDKDERAVSRRIALMTFGVRILSGVIAYVSQVLLARWMGDFEYGVFVVVWVGAVIVGGLACLGIQTAILRFVPEYAERGDVQLMRGFVVGSRIQGYVASTFFAIVGAAGLYFFGEHLQSYYLIPLYLGAITLPMLAASEIQDNLSRAFNWADLSLWPTFVVRPVLILIIMWGSVHFGYRPSAVTGMAAVIAATYLTSIGQLISLNRRMKKHVPAGPRSYAPAQWMAIALPIFIVEGFFNLLTNVDIIMVGHFMEPSQVAVYYAAAKTLVLVHFVYYAVKSGSAQRFSQYYASGDRTKLTAFLRDTLHWTFWPSLAMAVFLLVLGKPLLSLFGPTFASGYPLLFILSVGILVRASIGPAETLLMMAGQQGIAAVVYTATFAFCVLLNVLLIPRFGLVGAASAMSLALIAETIALYTITAKRLGIRCSIFTVFLPPRHRPVEAV
ncbi:MAG TPA: lipopolysaccharide biosynthesis protein [Bauldia sp.]|nr:lipopolysaccharide biosynthesis protein [Bauldia sp.]